MRRLLFMAAPLILLTISVSAQHRGLQSPRVAGPVTMRRSPGMVRGGSGVGNNPRFGVFFRPRPFFRRRHFFFCPFPCPVRFPFLSLYPIYPYYPLAYQSDLQVVDNYRGSRDAALASEIYRLQGEVDLLRQQQESQAEREQSSRNAPPEAPPPSTATTSQAVEAPPAVLIYRNGRRVEVHNYAVVGQTLWIFSEQRARKIPIEDLDLGATRRENAARGLDFLPQRH